MTGSTNTHPRREILNKVHFKIGPLSRAGSFLAIEFAIPHPDQAAITIYDMAGRKISSLVNQQLDAGSYRYFRDTYAFARGCYAVKLQTSANAYIRLVQIVN